MPKGFQGMPGGGMGNIMKQAQKMQKKMAQMQESLSEKILEVSSGGGAVKVTVNGEKKIIDLIISQDVIDPEEVEMLQDLIISAVNEAMRQMEDAVNSEMSKITGGLNMPGLF